MTFEGEIAKLVLQFVGALFVAWCTVRWALGRFKTEKMWERQASAIAQVLSSMREMQRVLDKWYDGQIKGIDYTAAYSQKLLDRYALAKSKLEEVSAIAIVILSPSIAEILLAFERKLADDEYESWAEEIEHEGAALTKAMGDFLVAVKDHKLI